MEMCKVKDKGKVMSQGGSLLKVSNSGIINLPKVLPWTLSLKQKQNEKLVQNPFFSFATKRVFYEYCYVSSLRYHLQNSEHYK